MDAEKSIQDNEKIKKKKMKKKIISIFPVNEASVQEIGPTGNETIHQKIRNKVIKNYILENLNSEYNKSCKSYRF